MYHYLFYFIILYFIFYFLILLYLIRWGVWCPQLVEGTTLGYSTFDTLIKFLID